MSNQERYQSHTERDTSFFKGVGCLVIPGLMLAGGIAAASIITSSDNQIDGSRIVDCAKRPTSFDYKTTLVNDITLRLGGTRNYFGLFFNDLEIKTDGQGGLQLTNQADQNDDNVTTHAHQTNGNIEIDGLTFKNNGDVIYQSGKVDYQISHKQNTNSSTSVDVLLTCIK